MACNAVRACKVISKKARREPKATERPSRGAMRHLNEVPVVDSRSRGQSVLRARVQMSNGRPRPLHSCQTAIAGIHEASSEAIRAPIWRSHTRARNLDRRESGSRCLMLRHREHDRHSIRPQIFCRLRCNMRSVAPSMCTDGPLYLCRRTGRAKFPRR